MSNPQNRRGSTVDPVRDLEQRCVAALTGSDKITSDEIDGLMAELDQAIVTAKETAEAERQRALDPVRSPDAAKARAIMDVAIFAVERLRTLVGKLKAYLPKVIHHEEVERWRPQFAAAKQERDKLAAELRECYVPFAERLRPLLMRIVEVNRECSMVNHAAPASADMWLASVEEHAGARPRLLHELQLPGWEPGSAPYWPRHT
jgi:hypothetical protein